MQVCKCKDAKYLLHELHKLQLNRSSGEWFFRGQRDSRWGLTPGLFRLGLPREELEPFENTMKDRMRRVLQARTQAHLGLYEDDEYLLALAQHYGAPTRLLDWSRSPEVAAYFAASDSVANATKAEMFSVFAMASIYENSHGVSGSRIIQPPFGGNDNMASQRGVFMLHNWGAANIWDSQQETHTERSPVVDADLTTRLLRFDLPTDRASEVLSELHSRGVEGSNVYPGNRGIVQLAVDQTWQSMLPRAASITET